MEHLFEQWYSQYVENESLALFPRIPSKDDAKKWFLRRANSIERRFEVYGDSLILYCGMTIDENWIKNLKNGAIPEFGDLWVPHRGEVISINSMFGYSQNIILEAKVSFQDFNVLALFNPNQSESFEDVAIVIKRGVLLKVHNANFPKVLLETEMPFETTKSY